MSGSILAVQALYPLIPLGRGTQPRNKSMIRRTILVLVTAGVMLSATACNTVKGLGRDIESVGEAGDKAIR
jgi:entericidin B